MIKLPLILTVLSPDCFFRPKSHLSSIYNSICNAAKKAAHSTKPQLTERRTAGMYDKITQFLQAIASFLKELFGTLYLFGIEG